MNRLILMRHAKTEAWHEGIDDHGRALLENGIADARAMGTHLNGRGWRPHHALVSTARRARETWRYASEGFGALAAIYEDDLYLAAPATLDGAVSAREWPGTLLMIGHNPGIHEFACLLARNGGASDDFTLARLFEKFPTGAAALFEAGDEVGFHPAAFRLVDVIRPKDIRNVPDP